mmetsp:Transcript_22047/g.22232  ORF Transcript_22047/g.22232 Transcript_22047/m.22232 type:complete len:110 (-) Transcript_22047:7-336(-)
MKEFTDGDGDKRFDFFIFDILPLGVLLNILTGEEHAVVTALHEGVTGGIILCSLSLSSSVFSLFSHMIALFDSAAVVSPADDPTPTPPPVMKVVRAESIVIGSIQATEV